MLLYRVVLACVFLVPARAVSDNDSGLQSPALKPLIQRANVYLSVGQFADAAKTYTEALEHAPSDYLLYYKRATAYFSMNRHSNALEDFNTVLHLTNGNFDKAVLMKAKILAKEANWSEAKALVKKYSKKAGTGDKDGQDLLFAIADGEATTKKAEAAQKAKKYDECIEHSTNALAIASHAVWLRELRLNCALAMGDVEQAIGDMTRLTHLLQPSTELFQKIANMSYFLLPVNSQPLQTLKQCLHFDPDSKPCRTSLRTLKAFEKDIQKLGALEDSNNWSGLIRLIVGSTSEPTGLAQRFDATLDASTAMLKLPASLTPRKRSPRRLLLYSLACKAYIRLSQITKAETWCNEVVNMDENNVDGLVGKAEAQMKQEEWEDAIQLLEKAFNASGRSREIAEKLEKARRLLKQARMKDYYKVLGVSRDADAQTIKKAYRKTSLKAHPDKGGSEAKMATVNEAYEVLSDPELRARYDRGDDPNDPESGRGQGGHPFHFGGGGPFQHMFFQQGGPFGGQQFHWSSG